MKATAELKKEHRAVQTMMEILGKICSQLKAEHKVPADHLEQVIEFIRVFTDKCHHGKEEDILFPALEAAGIPNQSGPIGVMLQEHDTMRGIIKQLARAIEEYKSGEPNAVAHIIQYAMEYTAWLVPHIEKEENILFMMADARLDESKQDELFTEFETLEEERIGQGVHEKFHENLHHLKSIYLKVSSVDSSEVSRRTENLTL